MTARGKVAVITGAASGFGEGMARRFAEERRQGAWSPISIQPAPRRSPARSARRRSPSRPTCRERPEVEAMVEAAKAPFGRVDILVNNAGYTHRNGDMLGVDEDDVRPDHRGQHEGDLPCRARRRADHGRSKAAA